MLAVTAWKLAFQSHMTLNNLHAISWECCGRLTQQVKDRATKVDVAQRCFPSASAQLVVPRVRPVCISRQQTVDLLSRSLLGGLDNIAYLLHHVDKSLCVFFLHYCWYPMEIQKIREESPKMLIAPLWPRKDLLCVLMDMSNGNRHALLLMVDLLAREKGALIHPNLNTL